MRTSLKLLVISLVLIGLVSSEAQTLPLRDLAEQKNIEIGSAVSLPANLLNPTYKSVLLREYNTMTVSSAFIWKLGTYEFRPSQNTWDFSRSDYLVNFATQNNLKVQAQHLVWGYRNCLPSWLVNGTHTQEELLSIMETHIKTVVGRYKGKVNEWSVVNETISRRKFPGIFGGDFWHEKLGPEYVEKAFRWAREADPQVKLILNDFGNEGFTAISDDMYALAKDFTTRGVPIDGVGLQMHLNAAKPPNKADVVKNMKRFGALGLKIYITEFDVSVNEISGTTDEKYAVQAQIYKEMMEACLESRACQSFVTYEFSDANTWYNYTGTPNTDPLPFDKNYAPKPAYFALQSALINFDDIVPSTPSSLVATVASSSQINLNWAASTDNVGVAGYIVYRNGTIVDATTNVLYSDAGLSSSTTYQYAVAAFDAVGNISPQSTPVSATIFEPSDSDGDGLLDSWEIEHFSSIFDHRAKPDLDVDGDGMDNISEFGAGTLPNDRNSLLAIVDQQLLNDGSGFSITWSSVSGKSYQVESSTNFLEWSVVGNIDATSGSTNWIDASASTEMRKFYRIRVL